jgi:hypothetical protein
MKWSRSGGNPQLLFYSVKDDGRRANRLANGVPSSTVSQNLVGVAGPPRESLSQVGQTIAFRGLFRL